MTIINKKQGHSSWEKLRGILGRKRILGNNSQAEEWKDTLPTENTNTETYPRGQGSSCWDLNRSLLLCAEQIPGMSLQWRSTPQRPRRRGAESRTPGFKYWLHHPSRSTIWSNNNFHDSVSSSSNEKITPHRISVLPEINVRQLSFWWTLVRPKNVFFHVANETLYFPQYKLLVGNLFNN